MNRLLAALRFLTVLPLPAGWGEREADLERSAPWFPVVGLAIGGSAALAVVALDALLPPLPVTVLIVAFLLAASGGLHLDGLADTADGFFSARPRERMLEIMRDSRVGTMGVVAVVLILSLKMAALASCAPGLRWKAVLLMPLAGRCALVLGIAMLSYVRENGGLGQLFFRGSRRIDGLWTLPPLILVSSLVAGVAGLAAALASMAAAGLFATYSRHKIGGATGDTLGAGCEIAETAPALLLCAWPSAVMGGMTG